ncbi:MAG: thiamine pyrophosphate-dependent enzyme [Pseudomonadota bacterium]
MAGPVAGVVDSFAARLAQGTLPTRISNVSLTEAGLTPYELVQLFESQATSRHLDLEARRLAADKRAFYSIGSAGHEGNAAVAKALRVDDMAFLHYRSGAFFLERARKAPGTTPIWDMALSFVASSDDPISGGRHKVFGSKQLFIPPQTSTIASHFPKAVGAAYSLTLAKRVEGHEALLAPDSVVCCSFGDASTNHSTAQGAFNAASWIAYRSLPLPLIFLCEDNGLGISVPTPEGWIAANFAERQGLNYIHCDGRDVAGVHTAAREAVRIARKRRRPVFLHMRTVRLMGHAGSDTELTYRRKSDLNHAEENDPLLLTARHILQETTCSLTDIQTIYRQIGEQVRQVMDQATSRPKLSSSAQVASSLKSSSINQPNGCEERSISTPSKGERFHMSRMISQVLSEQMHEGSDIVVFGEDVGHKGGVYGATTKLQQRHGRHRVFDTLLDEQTILGLAIGLAHNGFLPIPEIQFLAYVHNAEDQLRGEAATLSFFSKGQFANPMVVRVAGLGYQKGFGGHFHNDNSLAVFRDIPDLIVACPSSASDAARMMREAIRLAREEQRVVVFVEPIALYGTKDLHTPGDELMTAPLGPKTDTAPFGVPAVFGKGRDIGIVTYGNGTFMARRCLPRLEALGIRGRVIDLRWLSPLPVPALLDALAPTQSVLIVDECRRTGSLAEELYTRLTEEELSKPLRRLNSDDCFVPLGPAANTVLLSEADIIEAAKSLTANECELVR